MARIRVLRIQHSLVEPTNHRWLDEMARFGDVDVRAVSPVWGIESGIRRELRGAVRPEITVARTLFTSHYATTFYMDKLAALVRNFKPDIIDMRDEPYSLSAWQALLYRRLYAPQARLVFCSAQNISKKYPYPFSAIEKAMYATASAGYGCSGGVRDNARARGFSGIFEVVPLGLDPKLFHYRAREGQIVNRPFVIGYVGRISEEKGVFTLLKAFAALRGETRLVMAGAGPDLERARAAAQQAGVGASIELAGPAPHAKIPELIDSFDTLVVPSETTPTWKEQFGRVIAEAMSMGAPVVGSDSGSIPEVIGDAGLVFPEKDHEKLAATLQSLIDNPEQLPNLSEKGRRRATENFTWKRVAQINRDIYLRIME